MLQPGRKDCSVNYQNDLGRGPAGQMGKSNEKPKERHREWIALSLSLVHLATISFEKQMPQDRSILFVLYTHKGGFELVGECVGGGIGLTFHN